MNAFGHGLAPWEILNKALPDTDLADFSFDIAVSRLLKAEKGKRRFLQGVASTPEKDLQGEEVLQKGMDLRYFLKHGYLNDDHKPGFENKVGQPTSAEIKTVTNSKGDRVLGMWLEGYIWPEGVHKGADAIWELGKALEAADSDRRLGFSIQGKVLKREGSRILKAWIQDVAVTPSPVNTATWLEFVEGIAKSQWATEADVNLLRKSITNDLFKSSVLIEEPSQKAMGAAGNPQSVESLDDAMKVQIYQGKTEVEKAIDFARVEFLKRGFSEVNARSAALATVARHLLQ